MNTLHRAELALLLLLLRYLRWRFRLLAIGSPRLDAIAAIYDGINAAATKLKILLEQENN